MVLRENYFGGFTHFQTLGEHLSKRQRNIPTGDPVTLKFRPGSVSWWSKFILLPSYVLLG
jgi:hypothetical protein